MYVRVYYTWKFYQSAEKLSWVIAIIDAGEIILGIAYSACRNICYGYLLWLNEIFNFLLCFYEVAVVQFFEDADSAQP